MPEPTIMDLLQEIENLKIEIQTSMNRISKNMHMMEQIHAKILELKEKELTEKS